MLHNTFGDTFFIGTILNKLEHYTKQINEEFPHIPGLQIKLTLIPSDTIGFTISRNFRTLDEFWIRLKDGFNFDKEWETVMLPHFRQSQNLTNDAAKNMDAFFERIGKPTVDQGQWIQEQIQNPTPTNEIETSKELLDAISKAITKAVLWKD